MWAEAGVPSLRPGRRVWDRFAAFLPFPPDPALDLGEGDTPLLPAPAVGGAVGLAHLFVKLEGSNPTGSFKDRGSRLGVQRAIHQGARRVGTVSTGNMAASVAAYAARAGLPCVVLLGAEVPPVKLGPVAQYGPTLVMVEGDYGRLYRESLRLGPGLGIHFSNADEPFRVEGQKTALLEICEAFGFDGPDWISLPVSGGGNLAAYLKGLDELEGAGLLTRRPRLLGVQAEGCNPIAAAFAAGRERVLPVAAPRTICHAISNPDPPSGTRVLRGLRGGRLGEMVAVPDAAVEEALAWLGTLEGIFVQPDAAAALAGVLQARRAGRLRPEERIVCVLTGHGLKDPSIFDRHPPAPLRTPLTALEATLAALPGPSRAARIPVELPPGGR